MKSLKLFAVAAVFGVFFTACEAEPLNEDQVQIEEIEIISSTGSETDSTDDPDGN